MPVIIGRRELMAAFGGAAAAWPLGARAQQRAKPARIGYLSSSSPPDVNLESFIRGMGAVGYGEGRDFVIEARYARRDYSKFPALADELLRAQVDLIVAAAPLSGLGAWQPYRFRWCSCSAAIRWTPASSRASRGRAATSQAFHSSHSPFRSSALTC
jgi:hypothetical protein